jgi:hypothetical protein
MKKLLFVIACVSLSRPLFSQPASNDTLHWSASRKLQWKDFLSKTSDKNGVLGQATMLMNAQFHKGFKATTRVETVFDRKGSFAPPTGQTPQQLNYFQTMFDLYEAESRKLRKEFKETRFGLDPDKVFQEKYTAALKALNERVDNYMEETTAGDEPKELKKWSDALKLELKGLEAFSEEMNAGKK